MENKYYIYICYSRKDDEVAEDICHFLDQQGISYWIDKRNIESGDVYAKSVLNAIRGSKMFLYIISESSGKSRHCINELAYACKNKKPIYSLRIDQAPYSDLLLYYLTDDASWVNYSAKDEWKNGILQLFLKSTEIDNRVTQKKESEQLISYDKPSSWSSVRIGDEEKNALLKISCNRLCDVYIDGEYLCETRKKVIVNVPVDFGSYILSFEDKEDTNSYKTLAIDILMGTKSKAVAVELPESKGYNNKEEITCFIAGSKRLMAERDKMRAVVANMYVKWKSRNFLIETYSFDNFNHTVSEIGHQEEYNQFIKNEADLVLFLFDDEVGKETEKELNIAINSFKAKKHPQYIIYSKIKESVSPAINTLKERLAKEDVYWVDYESIEDLANKFERDLNDYLVRLIYIVNNQK